MLVLSKDFVGLRLYKVCEKALLMFEKAIKRLLFFKY